MRSGLAAIVAVLAALAASGLAPAVALAAESALCEASMPCCPGTAAIQPRDHRCDQARMERPCCCDVKPVPLGARGHQAVAEQPPAPLAVDAPAPARVSASRPEPEPRPAPPPRRPPPTARSLLEQFTSFLC